MLVDIIIIAITSILCGADDWNSIERFGKIKEEWFSTFLKLPNGVPSHDTFRRVFAQLAPSEFQECFVGWVRGVAGTIKGVIAIDGKAVRRSHDLSIPVNSATQSSANRPLNPEHSGHPLRVGEAGKFKDYAFSYQPVNTQTVR